MEVSSIDGTAKRTTHIGWDRTLVACVRDHGPPLISIALLLEGGHVAGPQPAWIAIELMLTQSMA